MRLDITMFLNLFGALCFVASAVITIARSL